MSTTRKEILKANNSYAENFGDKDRLPMPPGRNPQRPPSMPRTNTANRSGWTTLAATYSFQESSEIGSRTREFAVSRPIPQSSKKPSLSLPITTPRHALSLPKVRVMPSIFLKNLPSPTFSWAAMFSDPSGKRAADRMVLFP